MGMEISLFEKAQKEAGSKVWNLLVIIKIKPVLKITSINPRYFMRDEFGFCLLGLKRSKNPKNFFKKHLKKKGS